MDISERLRTAIETSVLCWLATVDADGQPNVSPKEIFCMGAGPNEVLVAEIASPVSKRNLSKNPKVCISVVDIFAQKGIKAYGTAALVTPAEPNFAAIVQPLTRMAGPEFNIRAVIRVAVAGSRQFLLPATSYSTKGPRKSSGDARSELMGCKSTK